MARLRFPLTDPRTAEFLSAVVRLNHLAEHSPGFIWRHVAGDGHVTLTDDDPLLVINLSVWAGYQSLHEFTYRSRHGPYVRRRTEWFERIPQPSTVLWWTPAGTTPSPSDGRARLSHLRRYGPTAPAFSLRVRFRPDGRRER